MAGCAPPAPPRKSSPITSLPGTADHLRLFVIGYYGFHNAGDEAILAAMLRELRAALPGAVFTVLSGDPAHTRRAHNVEAVHPNHLRDLAETIRSSELALLGGGGLVHDQWGYKPTRTGGLRPVVPARIRRAVRPQPRPVRGQMENAMDAASEPGSFDLMSAGARPMIAPGRSCESRDDLTNAKFEA
ncbi:MAG: polysaccharide pyruvyl transferase family protein [Chloroflexi bacterium]|nr:polysaccharide pyruvyl transferase family protein [Chloroflexota bacterium]